MAKFYIYSLFSGLKNLFGCLAVLRVEKRASFVHTWIYKQQFLMAQ